MVEKTITKINFWYGPFRQGETTNVWAYISKDFIANFNILAPDCQNIIQVFCIQWRIWLKWFLTLLVQKNSLFHMGPTPGSSKFAMKTFMKLDWHYSVKQWLTLDVVKRALFFQKHFFHAVTISGWISNHSNFYAFYCFSLLAEFAWKFEQNKLDQKNQFLLHKNFFWRKFACIFREVLKSHELNFRHLLIIAAYH